MRIRRVRLRNFRSHAETEVVFDFGVNAIIGQNGAGKTSLLEGIAYALFPELFRGVTSDLTRRGSSSMEVELEFEQGGRWYLVWRKRDRSGPQARLMIRRDSGWSLLQTSQRDVSAELARILGTNPEAFVTAMYVRQGEIFGFLEKKAAERMKTINRLLGGELFDRMERDLGEALGRFRSRLERLEGEISTLERQLKATDQLREDLSSVEAELEGIEGRLGSLETRLKSVEREEKKLRALRDAYLKLTQAREQAELDLRDCRRKISQISSQLESLDQELVRLDELKSLAELEPLLTELDSLIRSENALRAELSSLEREQRSLDEARRNVERLGALRKEYERISLELESVSKSLVMVEAKAQRAERLWAQLREARERLQRVEGRLRGLLKRLPPYLGLGDLDSLCREGGRLLSEARRVGRALTELEKRIEYAKGWMKFPQELLSALDSAPDECPLCGSRLDAGGVSRVRGRLRAELERGKAEFGSAEAELSRISELREALEEFERLAEEADLQSAIAERAALVEKVEEFEGELRALEADLRKRDEMAARRAELQARLSELQNRLVELGAAESLVKRLSPREEDRLARIETLKHEINEIRGRRDELLAKLGAAVRDVDSALRQAKEARRRLKELEERIESRGKLSALLSEEKRREDEIERRLSEISVSIEALGFDEDRYSELLEELTRLREEVQELVAKRENLRGKREELMRQLAEVKRLKSSLGEAKKERDKLVSFVRALEEVRRSFGREGIQRALREAARPVLEHYANEILSKFGVDFDRLELSEDYEVSLIRGGERFSFRQLSGGEQVALALSLRLGLAKAMAGTSLESILLDEPTVHLDSERRRELVSAIGELDLPQVIVVTHSGEFEEVASSLYTIEKRGGTSVVMPSVSMG